MALPIALASGVFHLNIRVPSDIAQRARGTSVRLLLDGRLVSVKASDKVIMSLRTRDAMLAKARFAAAEAALARHWEAFRAGPASLTHRQAVALAGMAYHKRVDRLEGDRTLTPEALEEDRKQADRDVAEWMFGDGADGLGELPIDQARLLAAIQRPSGPQLLAWETGADVDTPMPG